MKGLDNEKKASGWREGETVSTEKIRSVVLHMFANARVMETSVHTCDGLKPPIIPVSTSGDEAKICSSPKKRLRQLQVKMAGSSANVGKGIL